MDEARWTLVGLGEALFDVFGTSQILGGAPLNVAVHAHQLLSGIQGRGVVVSRVGQDALGQEVCRELEQRNMTSLYVQTDPDRATGQVFVQVDAQGQPSYDIMADSAWDWLQFDPDMESLARHCDAVCFGSLAQRHAQSRNTMYRFLDLCRPSALKLFDVNLRMDFYDRHILEQSMQRATVVKLNEEELPVVCRVLGLGDAGEGELQEQEVVQQRLARLTQRYQLKWVIYTRGAQGTCLYVDGTLQQGEPARYELAESADSVGAGDACAAGCMVGAVLQWQPDRIVNFANHLGAFVASQPGATPDLPDTILKML